MSTDNYPLIQLAIGLAMLAFLFFGDFIIG